MTYLISNGKIILSLEKLYNGGKKYMKTTNHYIRRNINEILYNIMRYLEITFSFIILLAIASQLIPLINEVFHLSFTELNMPDFTTFLANALGLVIGLEFVKMLCQHTADTMLEVLMFATAREMVVEHLQTWQTLIGVIAIGTLFAIRKYLLIKTPNQEHDKL